MKTLSKINILFFVLLTLGSCSNFKTDQLKGLGADKIDYLFRDKSGDYKLVRETGFAQKQKNVNVVKQALYDRSRTDDLVMERSIVFSKMGKVGNLVMLRPEKSEYSVWFEGKAYTTQMQLDVKSQTLEINVKNPETSGDQKQSIELTQTKTLYCFFSQIIECASVVSFIQKAIGNGQGEMSLNVIWEGYPYFQQQYPGVPDEAMTRARLTYDGENERGLKRFSLSFSNQVIFYQLNDKNDLVAFFWPAQGLSVSSRGLE